MRVRFKLALAGLVLVALFSFKTMCESSGDPLFPEERGLRAGIGGAIGTLGIYLAKLGPTSGSLHGEMDGATGTPAVFDFAQESLIAAAVPPEDADHGLERDDFIKGGEMVAESVNLLNGNAVETRLDLKLPSPNRFGLHFGAVYNSRSNVLGTHGFGWSHSYSANLTKTGGGTGLRIIDETGRARYFLETTPGGSRFNGLYQERTFVLRDANGAYQWRRMDGSKFVFTGAGALQSIEDPVRNRLALIYTEEGRLWWVSDQATGRTLTFNYNAAGFIESIKGPSTAAVPYGIWVEFGYTGQNLTSVAYADGSGFIYEYNDSFDLHNLTAKKDSQGRLITGWAYGGDLCTANFTRYGKGANAIEYLSGTEVRVKDAYNKDRTYTIATFGGRRRVTNVSFPHAPYREDSLIGWSYDDEMHLIQVEHAGGRIDRFENLNEEGYPKTVKLAYQRTEKERVIEYTYHPAMNVLLSRTEKSVLNPAGSKVTIFDYDDPSSGDPAIPNESPTRLLYKRIEKGYTMTTGGGIAAYTYTTSYTYNTRGQILTIDGPRSVTGDIVSFTYDSQNGNLLSVTQPLSGTLKGTTFFSEHNAAGYPKLMTDMNGHKTGFGYDGRSRMTEKTYTNITGDTVKSTLSYSSGDLSGKTDEDSVTHTYGYDLVYGRMSRINEEAAGAGNYVLFGYDGQGNVNNECYYDVSKQPDELTRQRVWNYQHPTYPGLLYKEVEPAVDTRGNAVKIYSYYASGMVSSIRDADGRITQYGYDIFNRLTHVIQPEPETDDHGPVHTYFDHDSHGNLTEAKLLEGTVEKINTYVYNDMGWLVSETTPDTGTTRYGYHAEGSPVWKIDAEGIRFDYTYDTANRLTAAKSNATVALSAYSVIYRYDEGTDGVGRLTGIVDPSGSTALSYDARGRLYQKTSTIGGRPYTLSRTFTDGGRVKEIIYPPAGNPAVERVLKFTRNDCACRVDRIDVEPGINLFDSPSYRPFGEVSGMSTGNGGKVTNLFNIRGEMTSSNPAEPMERSYEYDQEGRLLSVSAPNTPWYNRTFGYDALGRLEHAEGPFGILDYAYSEAGNRTFEADGTSLRSYIYTSGTNRLKSVSQPTVNYTHDERGRMITAGAKVFTYNQKGELIRVDVSGQIKGEYLYNGFGERVKKIRGGGISSFYLYDFDGNLVAETDSNGAIVLEYFYRGRVRLAGLAPSSGIFFFYHNNHMGTPELITSVNGTVIWEAIYKPFGEAAVHPNSTIVNNFRFQGQYYDAETGLYYNRFRYYDPKLGRYLTPDPIGLAGGINPYVYVQNDPVNAVDPSGLLQLVLGGAKSDKQKKLITDAVAYLQATGMNDPNVKTFFERFGYNIQGALTPGQGPSVYVDLKEKAHGYSRWYDSIFIGNRSFKDDEGHEVQAIASTISHELGHLAAKWYEANNGKGSRVDITGLHAPSFCSIDNTDDERQNPEGYAAEWMWWGFHWYDNSVMNLKRF